MAASGGSSSSSEDDLEDGSEDAEEWSAAIRTNVSFSPDGGGIGLTDSVSAQVRSARICFTRFIGAIGGRCVGTIGMVHPGTLFHRRQRGIPMHYENMSQIRALQVRAARGGCSRTARSDHNRGAGTRHRLAPDHA
jgi:hypothetical protein